MSVEYHYEYCPKCKGTHLFVGGKCIRCQGQAKEISKESASEPKNVTTETADTAREIKDSENNNFEDLIQILRQSSDLTKRCRAAEQLIRSGDIRAAPVLKEVLTSGYPNPPYLELVIAIRKAIKEVAQTSRQVDLAQAADNPSVSTEKIIDTLFLHGGSQRHESDSEKMQSNHRDTSVLEARLWRCETTDDIKRLIEDSSESELSMLIENIDVSTLPLNVWRLSSPQDFRFHTICFLCGILINNKRIMLARPLLDKILQRCKAKIAVGPAAGDEFSDPSHPSAVTADIINRFAQDLIFNDLHEEAATCLETVLIDFPRYQISIFWLFAAYHNLHMRTKQKEWAAKALKVGKMLLAEIEAKGSSLTQDKVEAAQSLLREFYSAE
jgi:hypothetical protein